MKSEKLLIPLFILLLFLISSCTPKITYQVTRPGELPVKNIKFVSVGEFKDVLGERIQYPKRAQKIKGNTSADQFKSNQKIADLVQSHVIAGLSKGGEYQILNSTAKAISFSGSIPNPNEVGVLRAKVRYYEVIKDGKNEKFFILLATNNDMSPLQQIGVLALKATALSSAERSGKGFAVDIPFVETVAALEIEFDFIRKSDGSKIIPTQIMRRYYANKWGGVPEKSILTQRLKDVIVEEYQSDETLLAGLSDIATQLELAINDSNAFQEKGYLLKQNDKVPLLSLDLRTRLVSAMATDFVNKISRHHKEAVLTIASGDSTAITLLNGNAYDEAINYIETLKKPLSKEDLYNLALAYEAVGEFSQAQSYYKEGLRKNPGNEMFQAGIKRVKN